jgi:hypothetical protein
MTTNMEEMLGRSRASLDSTVRDALQQGRTVRSRNRDGEYAIVLTDDRTVVGTRRGDRSEGVADDRAVWTIVVPDFTFRNVAESAPDLCFFAPVFDRSGIKVGTIAVNGSPYGKTTSDRGPVETETVFFSALRSGDLFRESETDDQGRVILFRATADADSSGRVTAVMDATGEERVFDLGPDYLAFKVA